jgi:hypothetical protein
MASIESKIERAMRALKTAERLLDEVWYEKISMGSDEFREINSLYPTLEASTRLRGAIEALKAAAAAAI